jgi:hypothetical protein
MSASIKITLLIRLFGLGIAPPPIFTLDSYHDITGREIAPSW